MALTEHQTLNTKADAFDIQYRYFSGPNWVTLIKGGLSQLAGWTAPDTGKPDSWTEITDRVDYTSRFTQTLQGASITWTADLSGWNYDATLMGLGVAVICWRRIWRPTGTATAPAGWQAWEREFLGEFVTRDDTRDYRAGNEWQRQVTGYNNWLGRYNAPRITAGKIRVTDGAGVDGSEELSQPELEKDRGEFVGGTANVEIDNVVDGNRNTVYISDTIPESVNHPWPGVTWDGGIPITEVFFKPLPGWPLERSWWVEVYDARSQNNEAWCAIRGATYDKTNDANNDGYDGVYAYWDGSGTQIHTGGVGVFVAHRHTFDDLFGADNIGAEFIYDVSQKANCVLTDDSAIVAGHWILAWSPGGAPRHYIFRHAWGTWEWHGPTIDFNALQPGQSYWWNGAAWEINPNPHPGSNNNGVGPIWIKVELPDNVCLTLDEISAASTTIRLDRYIGWLIPPPRGGESQGIINGCVFTWTSRDANGLHGVTWINAPTAPIPQGTRAYPYVDGVAQTGYPLTSTSIVRRKQPAISHYKIYWSPTTARGYPEAWWTSDYPEPHHEQQGNTQNLRLTDSCAANGQSYRWVRTLMYLIYGMTDGGRVKVNEIEAELAQLALETTGSAAVDGADVTALAQHLWTSWAGLPASDFHDGITPGAHKMGQHALAITPLQRVFDDLAQATGCFVVYWRTGGVQFIDNPWWPKNGGWSNPYIFDADDIRGAFELSQQPVYVDYVILNALSLDGDPHSLRYVYPQPVAMTEPPVWAMTTEVNDRVIAKDADAPGVAQMELHKAINDGRTARLTVKGVGEWCRPGLEVWTQFDMDGDGAPETMTWLIERVTYNRESDEQGHRRFETALDLRGFRG